MSNQSLKQASIRAVTGTALTYEGDWHALFDLAEIAAGTFNERLLAYINYKLSASHTELNGAMQAFAVENGADSWDGLGTFDASEGDGSLQDIVASCVFDLDATQSSSYGGSGTTWSNLVTAPADGSAQSAYNFVFGDGATSSTYPTFNGTAGDSAAYFSFDGGDYFTCTETITAFTENVSKTTAGQPFTAVICYQTFNSGVDQVILANGGNSSGTEIGYRIGQNRGGTGRAFMRFAGASSVTNALLLSSTADPSVGDNVLQYAAKDATTNYKLGVAGGEITGTTVAGGTSYANWVIGARPDGFPLSSGFRVYSVAMFNEVLDNDQLAAVKTALGARHGRTYT